MPASYLWRIQRLQCRRCVVFDCGSNVCGRYCICIGVPVRPKWTAYCRSFIYCRAHCVGIVNFGPNSYLMDPTAAKRMFAVAVHEISHSLGFSGSKMASRQLTQTVGGVTYVSSTAVVAKAAAQFGCSSLARVPLEDFGTAGSQGSHWEKRLLMNEYMTATFNDFVPVFSDLTYALFEDLGFYCPIYSVADELVWGRGKGCDFVNGACTNSVWQTDFRYSCSGSRPACVFDYNSAGDCSSSRDSFADKSATLWCLIY
jgi:hypothetical protein